MPICTVHFTVSPGLVTYVFQSEYTPCSFLNVKELLARRRSQIWRWSDCTCTRTQKHLVLKWTVNYLGKVTRWLSCVLSTYLYGAFHFMFLSCHVRVSERIHTIYCLNIRELLARSRFEILRWSYCNWKWNQNNLVLKRTLNHLAKLVKWLSCVLSAYLYGAFDSMFLPCYVRVSEWIHTIYFPECQGTPCSKQCEICRSNDCNWPETQNHLVIKRTLNQLCCVLSTYLYGVFDSMFLSCDVRVLEWIHTI